MSDPLPEYQYAYGLDAEVARLRAELEQARKQKFDVIEAMAGQQDRAVQAEIDAQRYRDALERIGRYSTSKHSRRIARDALAGDK